MGSTPAKCNAHSNFQWERTGVLDFFFVGVNIILISHCLIAGVCVTGGLLHTLLVHSTEHSPAI